MIRALGSVSSDIIDKKRGTFCCGHWILRLVISHTRQEDHFLRGIGFCVL